MIDVSTRVPVFFPGRALKSLRDSGYSFAAAVGEVIDNSLEANANNISVRLDEAAGRGKKHVHRVVVADDGTGMDDETLGHYLQIGFSTRYMSRTTIGKYGVGAKLAALNFGRRIDVWSRTREDGAWKHVFFDLDVAEEEEARGEAVGIDLPSEKAIPDEFADLVPAGTGTVVVWSKIDRLEEGRHAVDADGLRVDLQKELARTFRYFLTGGIKILVDRTALLAHDPLFLMTGTWADNVLADRVAREGRKSGNSAVAGGKRHFEARTIAKEAIAVAGSGCMVTVTLYPKEVVRRRQLGGDELAKRLRIPENEGSVSFVRLDREINYTNVPRIFPRGVQAADRFIGIEVSFKPDLDEYFGVRNVKRGVEPHGELRESIRKLLERYLPAARAELDKMWGEAATESQEHEGEHGAIVNAVKDVNRILPKSRVKDAPDEDERARQLEDLAKDVGKKDPKDRATYVARVKDLPFVLESVDFPGTTFIDIQHLGGQVLIRLNTRHRFYREMWEPIRSIATREAGTVSGDEAVKAARRTLEALSLLVVAYAKAESMDETPRERYTDLRGFWGQFLDSLMGKIKDVV